MAPVNPGTTIANTPSPINRRAGSMQQGDRAASQEVGSKTRYHTRQSPQRSGSYAQAYALGRSRSPSPGPMIKPTPPRAASAQKPADARTARKLGFSTPQPQSGYTSRKASHTTQEATVLKQQHQHSMLANILQSPAESAAAAAAAVGGPLPAHHEAPDWLLASLSKEHSEQTLDAEVMAAALMAMAIGGPSDHPMRTLDTAGATLDGPRASSPMAGSVLQNVRSMLREPTTPRAVTTLAQQLHACGVLTQVMGAGHRARSGLTPSTSGLTHAPSAPTDTTTSEEDALAVSLHRRIQGRNVLAASFAARAGTRARTTAAAGVETRAAHVRPDSYAGMPRPALFTDLPTSDHTLLTVRPGQATTAGGNSSTAALGVSTSAPGDAPHPARITSPPRLGCRAATASARVTGSTHGVGCAAEGTEAAVAAVLQALPAVADTTDSNVQLPDVESAIPENGGGGNSSGVSSSVSASAAVLRCRSVSSGSGGSDAGSVGSGSSSFSAGGTRVGSKGGKRRSRGGSRRKQKRPAPWWACFRCGLADERSLTSTPRGTTSKGQEACGTSKVEPTTPAPVQGIQVGQSLDFKLDISPSKVQTSAGASPFATAAGLHPMAGSPLDKDRENLGHDDLVILESPDSSSRSFPHSPAAAAAAAEPPSGATATAAAAALLSPRQLTASYDQLPTLDKLQPLALTEMLQMLQGVLLAPWNPTATNQLSKTAPTTPAAAMRASSPPGTGLRGSGTRMGGRVGAAPTTPSRLRAEATVGRATQPPAARMQVALRIIAEGGVIKRRSRSTAGTPTLGPGGTSVNVSRTGGSVLVGGAGRLNALPVHVVDGKAFALPSWLINSPRMLAYLPPWERTPGAGGSTPWTASAQGLEPRSGSPGVAYPRSGSPGVAYPRSGSPGAAATTFPISNRSPSPTAMPLSHLAPRDATARSPSPVRSASVPHSDLTRTPSPVSAGLWRPGGSPCPRGAYYELQAESKRLRSGNPDAQQLAVLRSSVGSLASLTASTSAMHWSFAPGGPVTTGNGTAAVVVPTSAPAKLRRSAAPAGVAAAAGRRAATPPAPAAASRGTAAFAAATVPRGRAAAAAADRAAADMALLKEAVRVFDGPFSMQSPSHHAVSCQPPAARSLSPSPVPAEQGRLAIRLASVAAPEGAVQHQQPVVAVATQKPATTIITLSRLIDQAMSDARKLAEDVSSSNLGQSGGGDLGQQQSDLGHDDEPSKVGDGEDKGASKGATGETRRRTVEVFASTVAESFAATPHEVHFVSHVPQWDVSISEGHVLQHVKETVGSDATEVGSTPATGIFSRISSDLSRIGKAGSLTRLVRGQLQLRNSVGDDSGKLPTVTSPVALTAPAPAQGESELQEAVVTAAAVTADQREQPAAPAAAAASGDDKQLAATAMAVEAVGVAEPVVQGSGLATVVRRISGSGVVGSIKRFIMRRNQPSGSSGTQRASNSSGGGSGGPVSSGSSIPAGDPHQIPSSRQRVDSAGASQELLPCPPTLGARGLQTGGVPPRPSASLQWEDLEVGDRRSLVLEVRASMGESVSLAPPRDLSLNSSAGGGDYGAPPAATSAGGVLERVREETSYLLFEEERVAVTTGQAGAAAAASAEAVGVDEQGSGAGPSSGEDRSSTGTGGAGTPPASARGAGGAAGGVWVVGAPVSPSSGAAGAAAGSPMSAGAPRSRAMTPTPSGGVAGMASPLRTASRASSSHLLMAALDPLATGIPCDWSSASLSQYEATLCNVQALLAQQEEQR